MSAELVLIAHPGAVDGPVPEVACAGEAEGPGGKGVVEVVADLNWGRGLAGGREKGVREEEGKCHTYSGVFFYGAFVALLSWFGGGELCSLGVLLLLYETAAGCPWEGWIAQSWRECAKKRH